METLQSSRFHFSLALLCFAVPAVDKLQRASLPVKCGSVVTQFKMADKLVAALKDKKKIDRDKEGTNIHCR